MCYNIFIYANFIRVTDNTEKLCRRKGKIAVDAVKFIIGNNNTYYDLEPGKDMLSFTEMSDNRW